MLGAIALGLAFAGSPERLPAGTQIAGVNVSGLTAGQARSLLEKRSRELANVPVLFTAAGRHWRVKPKAVVVDVDWGAAVEAAQRQGQGFGPLRGLKRLGVRVFGGEVAPTSRVYQSAVDVYMGRFARGVDAASVEPSLVLRLGAGDRARPQWAPARSSCCGEGLRPGAHGSLPPAGSGSAQGRPRTAVDPRSRGGEGEGRDGAVGTRRRRVRTGTLASHRRQDRPAPRAAQQRGHGTETRRAAGRPLLRQSRRSASSTPRRTRPSRSARATSSVSSPRSRGARWTWRRRPAT